MTWDLTSYFPEFHGPEMLRFKEAIGTDVAALQSAAASLPQLIDGNRRAHWEAILLAP